MCVSTTFDGNDPPVNALVEVFTPVAIALARLLASEGNDVRIAGPGVDAGAAATLRECGIRVEVDTDLDADPGEPEITYLDVWTPEVAPRVRTLRARGARIS